MTDKTRNFLDMLTDMDLAILACFLGGERALLRSLAESTGKSVEENLEDRDSRNKLLERYYAYKHWQTIDG